MSEIAVWFFNGETTSSFIAGRSMTMRSMELGLIGEFGSGFHFCNNEIPFSLFFPFACSSLALRLN